MVGNYNWSIPMDTSQKHCCNTDATVILNATAAGFGVATGPVLIDETRCVGTEDSLITCRHNGIGTHNCLHTRDVGLRCVIRKLIVNIQLLL